MPVSYRFEISPNNRAGCQNKECKDANLKIKKGELRFGTWIEYSLGDREIQGWKWRHWSCITPTVIQNLLKALGGLEGIEDDLNVIDGYDEMPQEWQEKILTMLREGHVPDEDWKGDVEQNRPGKRGSHKKAASTKKVADDAEDEDANETPTKSKATKRRRKNVKAEANSDSENANADGTPTKLKAAKARGKKVKTEALSDDEEPNAEETSTQAKAKAKATKGRGKKAKDETNGDDGGDNVPHHGESETQKKRKSGHLALAELETDDEEMPKAKPTRKPAKKIKVEHAPDEQTTQAKDKGSDGHPSRTAKSAKRKKTNTVEKQHTDDQGEPEISGETGKEVVKAEQLDRRAELNTGAAVKTESETITKLTVAKGRGRPSKPVKNPRMAIKVEDTTEDAVTAPRASATPERETEETAKPKEDPHPGVRARVPRKGVKVKYDDEDEDVDDFTEVPDEHEGEAALAPEPANAPKPKAKAKAGTKKGIAKASAKS